MKILVTGANGFIGRVLIKRLIRQGHEVWGLSQHGFNVPVNGLAGFIKVDIASPFEIPTELPSHFDFVYHLAAYNITHVGDTRDDLYQRINCDGTRNVINAIGAKRFIFLSTAKVYGQLLHDVDETASCQPVAGYEKSKLEAEKICQALIPSEDLVIFRSVNVLGEGQALKAVLPVFVNLAKQQQPINLTVPAQTPLWYIAVEDIVGAFIQLIHQPSVSGIYNIAYPQPTALGELANEVIKQIGSTAGINLLGNQHGGLPAGRLQTAKIQRDLSWQALFPIDVILKQYLEQL